MKVWADFWAGQASIVVSTPPPLSAEGSKAAIRNIASDTRGDSSSSTTTEGTASVNNSNNSSGGDTSSTVRGRHCTLFLRSKPPRMHDGNLPRLQR